jgi:hypothetical protein
MKKIVALALAAAAATSQAAFAAGIDISADTTQAKADIVQAGGLIVSVIVAVAAISWIRRVIR